MFVLTKQTDGANEGQRSGNEGFRWLADSLMAKALSYRDKLLELVGEPVSTGEMVFAARVIPTRDPVTGRVVNLRNIAAHRVTERMEGWGRLPRTSSRTPSSAGLP